MCNYVNAYMHKEETAFTIFCGTRVQVLQYFMTTSINTEMRLMLLKDIHFETNKLGNSSCVKPYHRLGCVAFACEASIRCLFAP